MMTRKDASSSLSEFWSRKVIEMTFQAANPITAVQNAIKTVRNNELVILGEIFQISETPSLNAIFIGKAAISMARGSFPVIKQILDKALIICLPEQVQLAYSLIEQANLRNRVKVVIGDHPIPSTRSIKAGKTLLNFVRSLPSEQLLLAFISGGGSAMVEIPRPGISLEDLQRVNQVLLSVTASITEINAIRKHLSLIKGGQLAKHCQSRIEALLISDVPNDDPSVIASGLFASDQTTFKFCLDVIKKHKLEKNPIFPRKIIQYFENNLDKMEQETPKSLTNIHHHVILSSSTVNQLMEKEMQNKGFQIIKTSFDLDDHVDAVTRQIHQLIQGLADSVRHLPSFVMTSGESLITIKSNGKGGRCTELGLRTLKIILEHDTLLEEMEDYCFIFLATDGKDGNTNSAGIYFTKEMIDSLRKQYKLAELLKAMNLYLDASNSYQFFEEYQKEAIISVDCTTTNVRDFFIGLFKKVFKEKQA